MATLNANLALLQKHLPSLGVNPVDNPPTRDQIIAGVTKYIAMYNEGESNPLIFNEEQGFTDTLAEPLLASIKKTAATQMVLGKNILAAELMKRKETPQPMREDPTKFFVLLAEGPQVIQALKELQTNEFFKKPEPVAATQVEAPPQEQTRPQIETPPEPIITQPVPDAPTVDASLQTTPGPGSLALALDGIDPYADLGSSSEITEFEVAQAAGNFYWLVKAADPENPIQDYDPEKTFEQQFTAPLEHFKNSPVYKTLLEIKNLPGVDEEVKTQAIRELISSGRTREAIPKDYIKDPSLLFESVEKAPALFRTLDDLRSQGALLAEHTVGAAPPREPIPAKGVINDDDARMVTVKGLMLETLLNKAIPGGVEKVDGDIISDAKTTDSIRVIMGKLQTVVNAYAPGTIPQEDFGTYTPEMAANMVAVIKKNENNPVIRGVLAPLGGVAGLDKVAETTNYLIEKGALKLGPAAPAATATATTVATQPSSPDPEAKEKENDTAPKAPVDKLKLNSSQEDALGRMKMLLNALYTAGEISTPPEKFTAAFKEAQAKLESTTAAGDKITPAQKEQMDTLLAISGQITMDGLLEDVATLSTPDILGNESFELKELTKAETAQIAKLQQVLERAAANGIVPPPDAPDGNFGEASQASLYNAMMNLKLALRIERVYPENAPLDGTYNGAVKAQLKTAIGKLTPDQLEGLKEKMGVDLGAAKNSAGGKDEFNTTDFLIALDVLYRNGKVNNKNAAEVNNKKAEGFLKIVDFMPDKVKGWAISFLQNSGIIGEIISKIFEAFFGVSLIKVLGGQEKPNPMGGTEKKLADMYEEALKEHGNDPQALKEAVMERVRTLNATVNFFGDIYDPKKVEQAVEGALENAKNGGGAVFASDIMQAVKKLDGGPAPFNPKPDSSEPKEENAAYKQPVADKASKAENPNLVRTKFTYAVGQPEAPPPAGLQQPVQENTERKSFVPQKPRREGIAASKEELTEKFAATAPWPLKRSDRQESLTINAGDGSSDYFGSLPKIVLDSAQQRAAIQRAIGLSPTIFDPKSDDVQPGSISSDRAVVIGLSDVTRENIDKFAKAHPEAGLKEGDIIIARWRQGKVQYGIGTLSDISKDMHTFGMKSNDAEGFKEFVEGETFDDKLRISFGNIMVADPVVTNPETGEGIVDLKPMISFFNRGDASQKVDAVELYRESSAYQREFYMGKVAPTGTVEPAYKVTSEFNGRAHGDIEVVPLRQQDFRGAAKEVTGQNDGPSWWKEFKKGLFGNDENAAPEAVGSTVSDSPAMRN